MTALTAPAPNATLPRTYPSLRAAWIPLAALCLAFFVEMVDNTILNIALPTIGRDLGGGTTALQWVTGAYSLTFGGLLLTAGSVADRFGRRRVLVAGLGLFGLVSLLVVAVTEITHLVLVRAALGVAAAGMAPVTASLIFRLFDSDALRMRAMTLLIVIGMSSFALGPVVAGSALATVSWHWLLLVNAPVALIAVLGVLLGVPRDDPADLHDAPLDLLGAGATIATIAFASYGLTSGVENGWTALTTLLCGAGALFALIGFVVHERTAAHPMLDLALLRMPTVRGAALAQLGGSIAMIGTMFGLILHFQYAFGWSPMRAGLANLPFVLTMMAATPIAEGLIGRFGHRVACLLGAATLTVSILGLAAAIGHAYWLIALAMVGMTLGLRIIMTICAVALMQAVPENRTSLGAALNDTSQELGTSVGVALVGTVLAALLGAALPAGAWPAALVASFFHAERVAVVAVAALVGVIALYGASTLTDSRATEEH